MVQKLIQAFGRIKPIPNVHTDDGDSSLKRCLTLFDLICYGVGCSVGAGVYSLVGVGAAITGPSISLSFAIGGLACIFTSLTYSEFAARCPITGSAYTFVYVVFGELAAWLIGWNLTLGYGISAAGIARSWAAYLELFLLQWGIRIPHSLISVPVWDMNCSLLAAILVVICSFVLLAGVRESAKFNAIVTGLNITVLLFVIIFGSTKVDLDNWTPFAPAGISGIMEGAGVIFFSYLGFDMVACLAEEVENPQKIVPRGIIGSLLISMSIYIGVSLVVTGLAPVAVLGPSTPLVNAFEYHHIHYISIIVSFGSMFGLTTAAFTCLMGQPRIFYQMSKDGLLPECLSVLSVKNKVPYWSTICTGILVATVAYFFDLDFLASVISCGTLMVFTFVNAGVLMLRLEVPPSSTNIRCNNNSSRNSILRRILAFICCMLVLSIAVSCTFSIIWIIVAGLGVVVSFISIYRLEDKSLNSNSTNKIAFKCPYVPLIPCLGIGSNIYMMISLPVRAWIGVLIWLSIGLSIYLGYGMHHSQLRNSSTDSNTALHSARATKGTVVNSKPVQVYETSPLL